MSFRSPITDYDIYLFRRGEHYRLWEKFGAHPCNVDGSDGYYFAVWAPNADHVSVVGDFNEWDETGNPLSRRGDSGIWEGFIEGIRPGMYYKYCIISHGGNYRVLKADPYAFYCERPPGTASVTWDLSGFEWSDHDWMNKRSSRKHYDEPISIYEVHLGSWLRREGSDAYCGYREIAPLLVEYVKDMGFTHVEFLPVMEHPFDGSWGYQVTGYFAPTSRFGTPQDFMFLINELHRNGIGVILDWVPAHFPTDEHGLGYFDGTHLYEYPDPRIGFHRDWNTYVFDYGRNEVRSFLLSSALFWCEVFHADGLRVDAVASMLYRDYSRPDGEWIPNQYGGKENLEAIAFIKRFNEVLYSECPGVMTIAEESTAWPMVSRPTYLGGLGFGFKWNMGWMHDTLKYMSKDPIYRKYHHNELTFSLLYAFHENFILPFSHDEVVHGKGSMINKMPGDKWQKFANLRVLYGYMFAHPGKKLLFMGNEFGQWREWNHDTSLDWYLLDDPFHRGLKLWVKDLNRLLSSEPALYELDSSWEGFRWIDCHDSDQSTLSFLRIGRHTDRDLLLCVCNFTPVPRYPFYVGVPKEGFWKELLNSDSELYGGSGLGNMGGLHTEPVPAHGYSQSLKIMLPPLAAVFFKPES
ncbi:1,4-alpha-glucan branching protein GlgB [Thermodesulforhabdus norvegica]|uniref:1,4-alpha-glucan branching enzyme GlgB n=1 Tax=Thermodesulforhabdus norvegica TaxID=39841 RepID=A0A1I4VX78_9BACT|nr:1,4-alpha-glucan branching protein GlgB [Thermodesulforhabdus norvegica]SFN05617.1 1,4-alpha-glucan branching enzyme [Thermodesulforhabdus norvegica]